MSHRWNLSSYSSFVVAEALECLQAVALSYPGKVVWISINFPSPYNIYELLRGDSLDVEGNRQLPSLQRGTFMVSEALLKCAISLLQSNPFPSAFYFQTNVEDVAITVKDSMHVIIPGDHHRFYPSKENFLNAFKTVLGYSPVTSATTTTSGQVSQLVDLWMNNSHDDQELDQYPLDTGGNNETVNESGKRLRLWLNFMRGSTYRRAQGVGWLKQSPMPIYCRTETEVACATKERPVYRFLYMFQNPRDSFTVSKRNI
jgi:hypothetical protein